MLFLLDKIGTFHLSISGLRYYDNHEPPLEESPIFEIFKRLFYFTITYRNVSMGCIPTVQCTPLSYIMVDSC